jgi:hypothetical protein
VQSTRPARRIADKFSGKYEYRLITGGVGHNLPQEAPQAFAQAIRSSTYIQLSVKDSRKYASTGGWGFAQFKDGKPADEAVHKTCFPCHELAKARDLVFTHYAP